MKSSSKESPSTSPLSSIHPSDEYLRLSLQPSTFTNNRHQKQLLCLDLNGTLCVRNKRAKKNFCVRPHYQSFFNYIFSNFTVMVWSSARKHSVDNMCTMFGHHQPVLIWNRNHFNLSDEEYLGNIETLKDLELIWSALPEFNATNTIVLDDSSHKLAAHPYNLIKMSTFHTTCFGQDRDFMDRDLCKVANYLRLLKEQSNVCNFMRCVTFDVDLPWGTVPNEVQDRIIDYYKLGRLESRSSISATSIPRKLDIHLVLQKILNTTDVQLYTKEAISKLKEIQVMAVVPVDKNTKGQKKRPRDQDDDNNGIVIIEDSDSEEQDATLSVSNKKERTEEQIIARRLKNQRRRAIIRERKKVAVNATTASIAEKTNCKNTLC